MHTLVGAAAMLVAAFVIVISHRGGPTEATSGYTILGRFASIDRRALTIGVSHRRLGRPKPTA